MYTCTQTIAATTVENTEHVVMCRQTYMYNIHWSCGDIHTYIHVQYSTTYMYIHSTNTATADTGDKGRRTLCVCMRGLNGCL